MSTQDYIIRQRGTIQYLEEEAICCDIEGSARTARLLRKAAASIRRDVQFVALASQAEGSDVVCELQERSEE